MNIIIYFLWGLFLLYIWLSCSCNNYNNTTQHIKILGRQTLRWATAAMQDESPLIAMLHANYGVAYLSALKDIAKDEEIERVLDINIDDMKAYIYMAQDTAVKKSLGMCPQFGPDIPEFVRRLSGE